MLDEDYVDLYLLLWLSVVTEDTLPPMKQLFEAEETLDYRAKIMIDGNFKYRRLNL